jgi:hypothetical protein
LYLVLGRERGIDACRIYTILQIWIAGGRELTLLGDWASFFSGLVRSIGKYYAASH